MTESIPTYAEPKCPSCNMVGFDHIVSNPSKEQSQGGTPWFYVAYCDNCGHIYGVFAKDVLSHNVGSFIGNVVH